MGSYMSLGLPCRPVPATHAYLLCLGSGYTEGAQKHLYRTNGTASGWRRVGCRPPPKAPEGFAAGGDEAIMIAAVGGDGSLYRGTERRPALAHRAELRGRGRRLGRLLLIGHGGRTWHPATVAHAPSTANHTHRSDRPMPHPSVAPQPSCASECRRPRESTRVAVRRRSFREADRLIGRMVRRAPREIGALERAIHPSDYRMFAGGIEAINGRWPRACSFTRSEEDSRTTATGLRSTPGQTASPAPSVTPRASFSPRETASALGMTLGPVGRTTFVRLPAGAQTSDGLELGRGGLGVAGGWRRSPTCSGSASS